MRVMYPACEPSLPREKIFPILIMYITNGSNFSIINLVRMCNLNSIDQYKVISFLPQKPERWVYLPTNISDCYHKGPKYLFAWREQKIQREVDSGLYLCSPPNHGLSLDK